MNTDKFKTKALKQIKDYKISTKSYTTIGINDIFSKLPTTTGYLSPKVDGHQYGLVFDGATLYFMNSSGTVFEKLSEPAFGPVLYRLNAILKKASVTSAVFIVELEYRETGKKSRANLVNKVIQTKPIEKKHSDHLTCTVLDVVQVNGAQTWPTHSYESRMDTIDSVFDNLEAIEFYNPRFQVGDTHKIKSLYEKLVEAHGHEGVVLSIPSHNRVFKIKPEHSIDAAIIGFTESAERPGTVDSILCAVKTETQQLISIGAVSNGLHRLTDKEHAGLFNRLSNSVVATNYKTTNKQSCVFTMVRPVEVVQLVCNDAIVVSGDEALKKPAFLYSNTYHRYEYQGQFPCPTPFNIKMVDFRPDKEAHEWTDIRIQQFESITGTPIENAITAPLPDSTLIKRAVYTREASGGINVRKFLLWATNKHKHSPDYPPYVVCYIDYSPTRKEQPIKRTIRPVQTSKHADELLMQLIECNIKRGWTLDSSNIEAVSN